MIPRFKVVFMFIIVLTAGAWLLGSPGWSPAARGQSQAATPTLLATAAAQGAISQENVTPLPAVVGAGAQLSTALDGTTNFVYLPLVIRDPVPLVNGNFESGVTGWTEYSTHGWPIIIDSGFPGSLTPHSGIWAAWLGGEYDDISYVQQSVGVPVGAPYLAYWHWIASADVCGYDYGGVLVNGVVVDVYDLCSFTNADGWVKHVVNLSAYAGQVVTLQIRLETAISANGNLFVDDVAFQASPALAARDAEPVFDPKTAAARSEAGVPQLAPDKVVPAAEFVLRPR